ncbi:MAG: cytochrome c3 family protein [Planctomycetes bacterium]|nr:cytochrome c3 family protein [Planctomycetota bacterium]
MDVLRRVEDATGIPCLGLALVAMLLPGMTACNSQQIPTRRSETNATPGWPKGHEPWQESSTVVVAASWHDTPEPQHPPIRVPLPIIPGADTVQQDAFCASCHETFAQAFAANAHHGVACESCHGGSRLHTESRGATPNTILSFRTPEIGTTTGKLISPAERSEICLQCHDDNGVRPGAPCVTAWRTSAHARQGVACTDCHRAHYLVPPGTPPVDTTVRADPPYNTHPVQLVQHQSAVDIQEPPGKQHNLAAFSPDVCYRCHAEMVNLERVAHPHQIGVPFTFACTSCHDPPPRGAPRNVEQHPQQFDCTTCHDPHGNVKRETKKELCLTCHDGSHMNQWHASPHELAELACTDCHDPHPQNGPPMAVDQPETCFRCHSEMRDLQRVAHAHQILGPNDFNCTTCHDPHDRVRMNTRRELCLECHDGAPTMAWHSSTHSREGVACADCHNPHPRSDVRQVVGISHTSVQRPRRLPMAVDEPRACYKCHPKVFGETSLPSHHPIAEGKMVCSDCHDGHGQARGNLKEATVNELCYECHAEKEGPFAYEHAPVTENCGTCHNPHGTVTNNLLHQPTTFLCLRCHSGHSTHGRSEQCFRCHFVAPDTTNVGGGPLDPMIPTTPAMRQALFTDCTQCHAQVHGSDQPSGFACFGQLQR